MKPGNMLPPDINVTPWEIFEVGDGTRTQRHADSKFWHAHGPSHSFGMETHDGYDRKAIPIPAPSLEHQVFGLAFCS